MRIRIEFDVDDEYADPDHPMGVTDEGYERIQTGLDEAVGAENVVVHKV